MLRNIYDGQPFTPNKAAVFAELHRRGVVKVICEYRGGNDEGGIEEIELHFPTAPGAEEPPPVAYLDPYYGDPLDEDHTGLSPDEKLSKMLGAPIEAKYGTWAGPYEAHGTLTWELEGQKVYFDDYFHPDDEYEYSRVDL